MQIHGDHMVASGGGKHVGHKLGGDGRSALILAVLSRIREVGQDHGDSPGTGGAAGVDHDQKLNHTVVDHARPDLADDENVLVSNTFANAEGHLARRVSFQLAGSELQSKSLGHKLGKPAVHIAGQ